MVDKSIDAANALDGKILAEITALKTEQIESNKSLPNAIDELKKQNLETAKKVEANQTKAFDALTQKIASNDPSNTEEEKKKNISALDALKEEMVKTKNQGTMDASKSQKMMGQQLQDQTNDQKVDAPSPSEEKETTEEAAAAGKKQTSVLKKMAAGIGGLFEMGKKGLKNAAKGGFAFLSTLAIGGLLIALGNFMQSPEFKDMTKYIDEVIIPALKSFWKILKDNWGKIAIALGAVVVVMAIVKILKIIKAIKIAFIAIKAVFLAVQLFFSATFLPFLTGIVTAMTTFTGIAILPLVAIIAGVLLVGTALVAAFTDAYDVFKKTGSIGEAFKTLISNFFGYLLGWPAKLGLMLVSWVAGLFGFDEFAKEVDSIDPVKWISEGFMDIMDSIFNWFDKLMTDPIGVIMGLVGGFISLFTDFGGFIYKKAIKPAIDWIFGLFGVSDASGQMESYIGDKLDNIINFAGAIYDEYIKPIVDWVTGIFSKAKGAAMPMLEAAGDMIGGFIKNIFRSILPSPDTFKFKVPSLKIPYIGTFGGGSIDLNPIPDSLYRFAGLDPKTGAKIPEPPKAVSAAADKIGSDAVVLGINNAAEASVKRDAAGAGGGSVNSVVNAPTSNSTINQNAPAGQNNLRNDRFSRLNKIGAE